MPDNRSSPEPKNSRLAASQIHARVPEYARIIKARLQDLDLNLKGLAYRLDVSSAALSMWAAGKRRPRLANAIGLAKELNLQGELQERFYSSLNLRPERLDILDDFRKVLTDPAIPQPAKAGLQEHLGRLLKDWRARAEVEWAVVPIAGWWTRHVALDSIATLVDGALAEASRAGLRKFLVIAAPEHQASRQGAPLLERIKTGGVEVITQSEYGLGKAIRLVQEFTGNEPFALIFPDEVNYPPCLQHLIGLYRTKPGCVLALRKRGRGEEPSYGVARFTREANDSVQITGLQEKPWAQPKERDFVILGRYILVPEIFHQLDRTPPNPRTGFLELTDALWGLIQSKRCALSCWVYDGEVRSISPRKSDLQQILERRLNEARKFSLPTLRSART